MDHETVVNAVFAQTLRETLATDADIAPIQRERLQEFVDEGAAGGDAATD